MVPGRSLDMLAQVRDPMRSLQQFYTRYRLFQDILLSVNEVSSRLVVLSSG